MYAFTPVLIDTFWASFLLRHKTPEHHHQLLQATIFLRLSSEQLMHSAGQKIRGCVGGGRAASLCPLTALHLVSRQHTPYNSYSGRMCCKPLSTGCRAVR